MDERLSLAIAALRTLEEAVATVEEHAFGGVFRCSVAPTLASLNFVRIDRVGADAAATVSEARAAAKEQGLTRIVLDAPSGNNNIAFESEAPEGEWFRMPHRVFVFETTPSLPEPRVERVTVEDFVVARRAFLNASEKFDAAQAKEEEEAARLFATKVKTQHWGAYAGGELASVGEIYFIDAVAQLESLSTLPRWERKGLGTAVTTARVNAAHACGATMVFAQIEAGNAGSVRLHERLGFQSVGARTTFGLVAAAPCSG
jgi:RimJ/RimL family protein N-acetyltransferase